MRICKESKMEVEDLEKSQEPLTKMMLTEWSTTTSGVASSKINGGPHQLSNQRLVDSPLSIHKEELSKTFWISDLALD